MYNGCRNVCYELRDGTGLKSIIVIIFVIFIFYMDRRVKAIVKLINVLYKPLGIEINDIDDNGFPQTLINIYFSEIDDSYISNPHHRDVKYLKERNFEFKLRKDILDYLDIKTSGLDPNTGFSPYNEEDITINVVSEL